MMMRTVALVACLAGQASALLQTNVGYALTTISYLYPNGGAAPNTADPTFNAANLYNYQYVVVGVCISTNGNNNYGSVMYSYNGGTSSVTGNGGSIVPVNGVVVDTWASSNCAGTATNTNVLQAPTTQGSLATYTFYTTLPTAPGTSAITRYFSGSGCVSGTNYGGSVQTYNTVNAAATGATCAVSATGIPIDGTFTTALNQFTTVTPVAATSTTPSTTVVTAGSVFLASYGNNPLQCGAGTVPQAINQAAVSTCSPMMIMGSAWGMFQPSPYSFQYTMGNVMSTQVIVYTAAGTLYTNNQGVTQNAVNPQLISIVVYNGAQCTGSIMSIQTYVSSTNYCFNNNQVIYASTPTVSASTTVSVSTVNAINQFMPAGQQITGTTIPSLFQINSFYTSLSGCQGSTTGNLALVQYQPMAYQQNTNSVCGNPNTPTSAASPAFWTGTQCTTATSSIPNNFAIVTYYDDAQCTIPVGAWGYQSGICYQNGATSSVMYTQSTQNGVTSQIVNSYPNNANCQGTPVPFTNAQFNANEATTNCYPFTSGGWSTSIYQRFTVSSTVGTSQSGTPNTGSQNGLQWVVRYTSQQACQNTQVSAAPLYQGVQEQCVPYLALTPTTLVNSGYFVTQQLGACAAPNPTAAPSAAPIVVGAPTIAPSFAPNNAPSSPSSSPACFAATEQVALENGASKAIADVVVGDRILTVNAKTGEQVYSDVAYLPHGKNTDKAMFTVLSTASGRDVKMTANHMLPAGACAAASLPVVAAAAVSVGDCVQTVSGREQVVSVSTVAGEGIYTAIAMEELLVVNGIVATPYGGVNPALANVYYNIHRLAYKVAGKAVLMVQGATEGVWGALASLAASR